MTQKDIDRLLAGRKVVDDYRSVAASYREADTLSKVTAKKTDIALAKEKYQDREKATEKMHNGLYKLGFGKGADPSAFESFMEFNNDMNFKVFKECRPIKGECDLCVGYDKDPPCKVYYKEKACINTFTPLLDDKIYKISFDRFTGRTPCQACPPGHGFQPDTANYKELPFDVGWK